MSWPVVTPSLSQTNRADLTAVLSAILNAFIAAHPTVTRKFWKELPASLTGEGPFVYVGEVTEQIAHDSGTRGTLFTGTLGYVDTYTDSQETNDRIDVFADFIREWFTANYHVTTTGGTSGILEQTGFIEGEMAQGSVIRATPKAVFRFFVQEGRT